MYAVPRISTAKIATAKSNKPKRRRRGQPKASPFFIPRRRSQDNLPRRKTGAPTGPRNYRLAGRPIAHGRAQVRHSLPASGESRPAQSHRSGSSQTRAAIPPTDPDKSGRQIADRHSIQLSASAPLSPGFTSAKGRNPTGSNPRPKALRVRSSQNTGTIAARLPDIM